MGASWLDLALSLTALPPAAAAAYLLVLTLLSRRGAAPPGAPRPLRIEVLVPAHDEESGVADTVRSLLDVDYPRPSFRVIVVADNCRDRTAAVAEAAGAEVLVREDPERRGKGYALRFGFDHVLARGEAEAVAVVDADTVVSANLLRAFAARFAEGASARQAHYGVRNAGESWRTRLLAIAFGAIHGVRSLARERLGLSCGLRGNGMAFTCAVLREVPHQAFTVVEDVEYGVFLAYRGHRVEYVAEAEVLGQMAATAGVSRAQRSRWEGGRRSMARAHVAPLLQRAFRARSAVLADLAADLLVPPAATLVLWSCLGLAASFAASAAGIPIRLAPWLYGGALAGVAVYVLRGWSLSSVGGRGLLDLLLVPAYVAWKMALRLRPDERPAGEWVRTRRPGERLNAMLLNVSDLAVDLDLKAPAASPALDPAVEAVWVAAQKRSWSSLVIVPAEARLDPAPLARAVAAAASRQRGEAVEYLDLRRLGLAESRPLADRLADKAAPPFRLVAAVRCPLDDQTALLLSSAADAAI